MSKSLKQFKEQFDDHSIFEQMVQEVLSKDADAGAWIKDFVKSDNPKFAGKSKEQRKKMALGAYYAKQRNEEVESVEEALKGDQHKIDKNKNNKIDAQDFKLLRKEETVEEGVGEKVKTGFKKFLNKVGGGSDEDQLKRLRGNMYGKQKNPSNPPVKEETQQVEEGWDDMVKSAKDTLKDKPQDGGSGVKKGSRYGGSKQKDKPEQEEDKKKVNESKRPEDDSVPFAPPYNTTSSPEFVKDKSGAVHTPMSRAKNLAQLAMKKMRKELGQKGK